MNGKLDNDIELGADLSTTRRIAAYLAILLVYLFYCYNFYILSVLGPFMRNQLHFTNSNFGLLFSLMSFGTLFGTIIAGKVSIRWGRKTALELLGIGFSLFTLAHIAMPESFIAWAVLRFCSGIALGGIFGTAISLIVGLFPQRYRGRLTSFASCLFAVSGVIAGKVTEIYLDTQWTMILWWAVIPTLVGIILVHFLVPSDRHIVAENKKQAQRNAEKLGYAGMLQGKYLWIGLLAVFLSGMNFSGYSGFSQFVPIYLQDGLGMSTQEWARMIQIQNIGHFIGFNFWGFIGDRFGRKKNLIGMIICAAIIPVYMGLSINFLYLLFAISFLYGIGLGYSGVWGAYYTELFPAKYRSLSSGFCFNMGRIISMITVYGIGLAADALGMKTGLLIPSIFFALGCVAWMLLPETLTNPNKIKSLKKQTV
ncbi:Gentisate transporter [invertebrate metagenome]|uniref:Gentisate transporter n=1 Tax=invertebrate metagenome TaxID=1711999 RepID=A0A2H9T965_9ZZZZ